LKWRYHEAIMAGGGEDESKKIFLRPENESTHSYYEIWPLGRLYALRFS
jgi:hypothetical protein